MALQTPLLTTQSLIKNKFSKLEHKLNLKNKNYACGALNLDLQHFEL